MFLCEKKRLELVNRGGVELHFTVRALGFPHVTGDSRGRFRNRHYFFTDDGDGFTIGGNGERDIPFQFRDRHFLERRDSYSVHFYASQITSPFIRALALRMGNRFVFILPYLRRDIF